MASWGKNVYLPHGYLRIGVTLLSQDVTNNRSTFQVASGLYNTYPSGSPTYSNGVSCALSGSGGLSASTTFNINVAPGGSQPVMSRNVTVDHDPDGTLSATFAASIGETGTSAFGSGGLVTITFNAPKINRASQPTVSPTSVNAGDTVTIQTHRASTSYKHDLTYKLGSQSGTIVTGLATDYDWDIPLSVLSGIPNDTSGTCVITCVTKSGSTVIGTRTVNLTVKAPSSVVPAVSSISCTEAVVAVDTAVGAFVQKNSKLNLAATGAGVYGSTIAGYKITVDGQTVNAASGTTGLVQSAGTLTVTATVTDSRGRTGTASTTIEVLPYAPPAIDTDVTGIVRADSDGTVDVFNGTYLLPTLKASVTSLKPASTEKNTLTYKVLTRSHGTGGTYVQKSAGTPSGVTFDDDLTAFGTYDVSESWDVLIEVIDLFATTQYLIVVPTGAAILDLRPAGVGVLKRWENGALDVNGDTYVDGDVHATGAAQIAGGITHDGGKPVLATAGGAVLITPSAVNTPTSVTVTLPINRFSSTPAITTDAQTGVPTNVFSSHGTPSATGFDIYLVRTDSKTATTVRWTAIEVG